MFGCPTLVTVYCKILTHTYVVEVSQDLKLACQPFHVSSILVQKVQVDEFASKLALRLPVNGYMDCTMTTFSNQARLDLVSTGNDL